MDNPRLKRWLDRLERWSLNHRKFIYTMTIAILVVAVIGILRLESNGYIVDDLPKTDKIYTDLKFFEKNFKGVMPLEIVIDTKKKRGVTRSLSTLLKIDSLSQFLAAMPEIGRPLNITEGLKFAKQAFFEGDTASYSAPTEFDMVPLKSYLEFKPDSGKSESSFGKLVSSFIDSNKQEARISVSMRDVGSYRLPQILDTIQQKADQIFDTTNYHVQLTGASVTFLDRKQFYHQWLKRKYYVGIWINSCLHGVPVPFFQNFSMFIDTEYHSISDHSRCNGMAWCKNKTFYCFNFQCGAWYCH